MLCVRGESGVLEGGCDDYVVEEANQAHQNTTATAREEGHSLLRLETVNGLTQGLGYMGREGKHMPLLQVHCAQWYSIPRGGKSRGSPPPRLR